MGWFSKSSDEKKDDALHDANFYLYFSKENKPKAEQLEKELTKMGFKADPHWMEDEWSLTLNKQIKGKAELYELEKLLTRLAKENGGEYDGHEMQV